ncbi:hypothetical protein [Neisseria montereyensis]|uniref:Adhesin n=1 Tax=Neisseria montereyensis TaxID=2973938 RepID=A0ABT2FCZ2_9NEIS|nr:hypothetical protein [Neisseria montereyensis]MCS4534026.1 hypothetical protein [Neisseria montereyensis]
MKPVKKFNRIEYAINIKNIFFVFALFGFGYAQANGIDGTYQRIGQTHFEAQHGMSSALVITNKGKIVRLKNAWGDTPLKLTRKNGKNIIQQNGFDLYQLDVTGKTATLTDIDNIDQVYRFERERR